MLEKVIHHRLLREGAEGQGVITEKRVQGTETTSKGWGLLFSVHGHIKYPDGSQSEFSSELLNSMKVGDLQEGAIVPVRYAADDHSKVVLDIPALEAGHEAAHQNTQALIESLQERRIAEADAQIAAGASPATTAAPDLFTVPASAPAAPAQDSVVDKLAKLADLKDRGALTQSEFDAEKRKLLGS